MKAAVVEEFNKPLVVQNFPDPECGPNDVIVQVKANGVCRSDWHAWVGDWEWIGLKPELPHILGHEFAGIIEEVGANVKRFKKGDRVVIPFSMGCGKCSCCQTGHQNVCENLTIFGFACNGSYAQYTRVPLADVNLVHLPESIDFTAAASLGCRFMTSFHAVADISGVKAGDFFTIYGAGGVGLAATQIANSLGARVIAVDIDDSKLDMAKSLGAFATVNSKNENPIEAIMEITKGGSDISYDALGIAETCRNAILSLRNRGTHVQVGLTSKEEGGMISLPTDLIVAKELQIKGSLGMQAHRYQALLSMVESGQLHPEKLVSKTIPLEEASSVLESMGQYGTVGSIIIDRF
ncbi:D-arabinose 1-dehydrogenase-like Zn-dependent alcohol dehydrogenase [Oikeobacillus pervagus]|uniref:D-arabinose 1-dehydrogenase-like Zn-dependent alcohol dehydrogenase n=1 Tax=Oikeobacillus pervagus TaxID=1325931 RepID=A0AAJ1WJW9_9BACI|nr:zinc-dependent alcohol dehydrogenase family protein [Oikeobacillus pervagus]MDQ0214516.1 D-arabinose 1-dehydrogenase-like Zn-dependent alcohol dehydrogenase [Oikeobacillus pervagus]